MRWISQKIDVKNLKLSYDAKYGILSTYQQDKIKLYSDPDICCNLKKAFKKIVWQPNMTMLVIGINDGYELNFLKRFIGIKALAQMQILGFDLSLSALKLGKRNFSDHLNIHWIYGDISAFKGRDIATNQQVFVQDKSVDIVLALTSLQSTSLADKLEDFIQKLQIKLKPHAQLVIATPDCHINKRGVISRGGLFDPEINRVDSLRAKYFVNKISTYLQSHDFTIEITGDFFKFIYGAR